MINHFQLPLSSFLESTIAILQKAASPPRVDPATHRLTAYEMPATPVIGILHAHQCATEGNYCT
jgi:hypothetical protein